MSEANYQFLKLKNSHTRDNNISFVEEGHIYTVHGQQVKKSDGWVSTTGLVHSSDFWEHFDPDSVISNMMRSKNWRNSPYFGMTRQEIKDKWSETGRKSCEIGSKFHLKLPETYYNNEPLDDDPDLVDFKPKFMKFVKDHEDLTPFRTEMLVYDEELKITGSIDFIFQEEDGSLSIYDWKVSKSIETVPSKFPKKSKNPIMKKYYDNNYSHYSMQLNIYKYILEKNYGYKIKDLYLIRFYENIDPYEKIKCLDMSKEIDIIFKQRLHKLAESSDESENDIYNESNECML